MPTRTLIFWICLALCWAGLLLSRALFNFGIVGLQIAAVAHWLNQPLWRTWLQQHRYLWVTALFWLPFFSVLAAEAWPTWWHLQLNKLPLLLIPLSIPFLPKLTLQQQQWGLHFAMGICSLTALIAVANYFTHLNDVHQQFKAAKVLWIPTKDHVRVSWAIVLAVWCYWHFADRKHPWFRVGGLQCVGLFLFLHLLGAKTGLIAAYALLFFSLWQSRHRFNTQQQWIGIGLLVITPFAAWFALPSLKNRIQFIRYDWQQFFAQKATSGLSDTPRLYSWQAGWELWQSKPFWGHGWGNIRTAMDQWYQQNTPFLQSYEWLYPSNEWLFWAAANGIVGILLLGWVFLVLPWRYKPATKTTAWLGFWGLVLFAFGYEIPLETQFGVFLSVVLGCCWSLVFPENFQQSTVSTVA